jgi:hypothetical protein
MSRDDRDQSSSDDPYFGIPKTEVDAWAERERERRRRWVEGPSEDERREWAARQSRRRPRPDSDRHADDDDVEEGRRVADRLQHDAALALVGVANRLAEAPYRLLGDLVRSGRSWEDEFLSPGRRRRRVRYRDED